NARAIDITGAGAGMTIQQIAGLISGDVLTTNEYEDVIDWTGGAISGNVFGNTDDGEVGDRFNVRAGEETNSFVFTDNIYDFNQINVNTVGYSASPVTLRLKGKIVDATELNVNGGGTLIVGRYAEIGVGSYTQDTAG